MLSILAHIYCSTTTVRSPPSVFLKVFVASIPQTLQIHIFSKLSDKPKSKDEASQGFPLDLGQTPHTTSTFI